MANRASPSVYLAGPITGQTQAGAFDWRVLAISELEAAGIIAFSPMRMEEYTEKFEILPPEGAAKYGNVPINAQGIVARDRNDVMTCDLTLMNLIPSEANQKVSIGSMIEIGWADAFRAPLVVCMSLDTNPHWHGMVRGISPYIVPSLEAGLALTKAILLPYHPEV